MMKQMIRCVLTEGVVESPSLKKQSPWRTDTLPLMFLVPIFMSSVGMLTEYSVLFTSWKDNGTSVRSAL